MAKRDRTPILWLCRHSQERSHWVLATGKKVGYGGSLGNMSPWGKWTHIIKYHSRMAFKWLQLFFEAWLACRGFSWEQCSGLTMSAWHLCNLVGDCEEKLCWETYKLHYINVPCVVRFYGLITNPQSMNWVIWVNYKQPCNNENHMKKEQTFGPISSAEPYLIIGHPSCKSSHYLTSLILNEEICCVW